MSLTNTEVCNRLSNDLEILIRKIVKEELKVYDKSRPIPQPIPQPYSIRIEDSKFGQLRKQKESEVKPEEVVKTEEVIKPEEVVNPKEVVKTEEVIKPKKRVFKGRINYYKIPKASKIVHDLKYACINYAKEHPVNQRTQEQKKELYALRIKWHDKINFLKNDV